MVKILRCCSHKPNDKCDLTGAEAPYAHEYETFINDGDHHNKVFTSQDALNLAISESEKLEKDLGIEITIEEDPQ